MSHKSIRPSASRSKAVSPILESILLLIISIAVIFFVFSVGIPFIEKLDNQKSFESGKLLVGGIDSTIAKIRQNEISSQDLVISMQKGKLIINSNSDEAYYELESIPGIVEKDLNQTQGNVFLRNFGKLQVGFRADDVNMVSGNSAVIELSPGTYTLEIAYLRTVNNVMDINFTIQ